MANKGVEFEREPSDVAGVRARIMELRTLTTFEPLWQEMFQKICGFKPDDMELDLDICAKEALEIRVKRLALVSLWIWSHGSRVRRLDALGRENLLQGTKRYLINYFVAGSRRVDEAFEHKLTLSDQSRFRE